MNAAGEQNDRPSSGEQGRLLTLVSNSPQRVQLLREAGLRFEVVSPRYREPEEKSAHLTAAQHAQALAYFKVRSVADDFAPGGRPARLLLGADTVVAAQGRVFGKPADRDDARRMLRTLTAAPHEVITGLALLAPDTGRRVLTDAVSRVTFKPIDDARLEQYLDEGGWRDKAGGYGLQAGADAFVARIEGSRNNVIGLPTELLVRLIEQFG